ncbi:flavin reductase family protein [Frankia sp. AvcI1]|uniref:flavin reductase family protein n=2 Tax=Frankia sp. AvcI1 TaxID=573496 RepID=UPI0021175061|nr:flavin reductase family protein [Frankia sp. AvcI1]
MVDAAGPHPATLRRVLGHYPSGVTVVTAVSDGVPVGFACQSFHSLSLDPPMILVLPARGSTTWPKIRQTGLFCVNILAQEQADLCQAFAVSGGEKFRGVDWRLSDRGSPIIAGASAWIDCDLVGEHDGGDHTIAVGLVMGLESDESRAPLIFHRGTFHTLERV